MIELFNLLALFLFLGWE